MINLPTPEINELIMRDFSYIKNTQDSVLSRHLVSSRFQLVVQPRVCCNRTYSVCMNVYINHAM